MNKENVLKRKVEQMKEELELKKKKLSNSVERSKVAKQYRQRVIKEENSRISLEQTSPKNSRVVTFADEEELEETVDRSSFFDLSITDVDETSDLAFDQLVTEDEASRVTFDQLVTEDRASRETFDQLVTEVDDASRVTFDQLVTEVEDASHVTFDKLVTEVDDASRVTFDQLVTEVEDASHVTFDKLVTEVEDTSRVTFDQLDRKVEDASRVTFDLEGNVEETPQVESQLIFEDPDSDCVSQGLNKEAKMDESPTFSGNTDDLLEASAEATHTDSKSCDFVSALCNNLPSITDGPILKVATFLSSSSWYYVCVTQRNICLYRTQDVSQTPEVVWRRSKSSTVLDVHITRSHQNYSLIVIELGPSGYFINSYQFVQDRLHNCVPHFLQKASRSEENPLPFASLLHSKKQIMISMESCLMDISLPENDSDQMCQQRVWNFTENLTGLLPVDNDEHLVLCETNTHTLYLVNVGVNNTLSLTTPDLSRLRLGKAYYRSSHLYICALAECFQSTASLAVILTCQLKCNKVKILRRIEFSSPLSFPLISTLHFYKCSAFFILEDGNLSHTALDWVQSIYSLHDFKFPDTISAATFVSFSIDHPFYVPSTTWCCLATESNQVALAKVDHSFLDH